jgi:malonyl CoA-acyl carrier protein transacylase
MTSFLFPGQGSQKIGMGDSLFDQFPDITQTADRILGYSIKTLCLEDPQNQLNDTQFTQPALYTVNALMYYQQQQEGRVPSYCAGHSLGEYNALLSANVFNFEDGLKLVKKRGQLMSQASGGGMAAIIGLTVPQIQDILTQNNHLAIEIANLNSQKQTVITGKKTDIDQSLALFKDAGARLVIPLKVSGAFHSSMMTQAKEDFTLFLKEFTFNTPQLPVIANVTAQPYTNDIAGLLSEQITSSVRWTETIQYLIAKGEEEFVEVGPGKVLAGLVQAIQKG